MLISDIYLTHLIFTQLFFLRVFLLRVQVKVFPLSLSSALTHEALAVCGSFAAKKHVCSVQLVSTLFLPAALSCTEFLGPDEASLITLLLHAGFF